MPSEIASSTTADRPETCETCHHRKPSSRTPVWGWACYICKQRWQAGKDGFLEADRERAERECLLTKIHSEIKRRREDRRAAAPKPTPIPEPVCPPPAAVEPPVVSAGTPPSAPDAGAAPLPPEPAAEPAPVVAVDLAPAVVIAPPEPARRSIPRIARPEGMLLDRVQEAMTAEPTLTSIVLAERFTSTPASVRSAIKTLRDRGLLPPSRPRPILAPHTLRGRLLKLIEDQPGISGIRAARILGVAEESIHDAISGLRKRELIAPADASRPGGYPLPSATTSPQEPPMPVQPEPDPAAAPITPVSPGVLFDIAAALGIDDPEQADQQDILLAARVQGESVARLIAEKQRLSDNLQVSRSNLSAANGIVCEQGAELQAITAAIPERHRDLPRAEAVERLEQEVADLRGERAHLRDQLDSERVVPAECAKLIPENSALLSEVSALRNASRLTLTREDLDARIADFRAADEAEGDAEDFATAADTGRPANIFGIDLDAADLRALAAVRTEQARVLRQRALEGR